MEYTFTIDANDCFKIQVCSIFCLLITYPIQFPSLVSFFELNKVRSDYFWKLAPIECHNTITAKNQNRIIDIRRIFLGDTWRKPVKSLDSKISHVFYGILSKIILCRVPELSMKISNIHRFHCLIKLRIIWCQNASIQKSSSTSEFDRWVSGKKIA